MANEGITSISTLDDMMPTIVSRGVVVAQASGVIKNLFDKVTIKAGEGSTYKEVWLPQIDAQATPHYLEFNSFTQIGDEAFTVAPSEALVGIMFSKRGAKMAPVNVAALLGEVAQDAIENYIDVTGLAMGDGFSNSVGSGTATTTWGILLAAVTNVKVGKSGVAAVGARASGEPPTGQRIFAILHDYMLYDLLAQGSGMMALAQGTGIGTTAASMSGVSTGGGMIEKVDTVLKNYFSGRWAAGAGIYTDNNLLITSNASKGFVCAEKAVRYVEYPVQPPALTETDDKRFYKMIRSTDFGFGEYRDSWGVELNLDCTAPSI